MKTVFIDGKEGTTGLRIFERLAQYKDIEVVSLPDDKRKDTEHRRKMLNSCDIAFLCLPDEAAIEAVSMVTNEDVVIIDTSTAHRCDDRFAYGFPELSPAYADKINKSKRIAVPGCHASGFISLIQPLISHGVLSPQSQLCCHSLTGYSGGGKKMIAQYEAEENNSLLSSPRQYGLSQTHKHLPEMTKISGLETPPVFCPIVADYYSGMLVSVGLFADSLSADIDDIRQIYAQTYKDGLVRFVDDISDGGFIASGRLSGSDIMEVSVTGNDSRIVLTSRYDNLGKGASGAAVECLNIKLGNEWSYNLNV